MTLLDTVGLSVWRASWQGGVLALLVLAITWSLGERLTPRWRYLLWSVVIVRLLLVVAPAAPWSLYNVGRSPTQEVAVSTTPTPSGTSAEAVVSEVPPAAHTEPSAAVDAPVGEQPLPEAPAVSSVPAVRTSVPSGETTGVNAEESETARTRGGEGIVHRVAGVLPAIWLGGCVFLVLRLVGAAWALRRQLRACRSVSDPDLLGMLDGLRRQFALRQSVRLLVTPDAVSPYVVGTWRPAVVVPESLLTEPCAVRLRQVFAHELAHILRGDLWMNWFLLAARALHWFNPLAWQAVRAMQAEREAACDEMTLEMLQGTGRDTYVATIVELASSFAPAPMAPGMIGMFATRRRLKWRMERLLRPPASRPLRSAVVCGLLGLLAVVGLTDAMPQEAPEALPAVAARDEAVTDEPEAPEPSDFSIEGKCLLGDYETPHPGVRLRLVAARGLIGPAPEELAETVSDEEGRFAFAGLAPPRPESDFDRLAYGIVAEVPGGPMKVVSVFTGERETTFTISQQCATVSGRVVDERGRVVAGATVTQYGVRGRPVPGVNLGVTDEQGRFEIGDLSIETTRKGEPREVGFRVLHPEFPAKWFQVPSLPAEVKFALPAGCILTGKVVDGVTGRPAGGLVVTAQDMKAAGTTHAMTGEKGEYRVAVTPGNYNVFAQADDRVCVAITDRECPAGESIELPPLTMIRGGLISGRLWNTATNEPVVRNERGARIAVGLFGPSRPPQKVISAAWLAEVDDEGRFVLRAAPGDNYPYLYNQRGSRMSWDTRKQDPVVVVEGETVETEISITPPVPPEEKMAAAREILEGLPEDKEKRVAAILEEFRKLSHTVDETEIWCLLMRDLVGIGSAAVPQLCAELDRTEGQRMMRRLGFALRAIGDPRAVPALIRAIPKVLQPSMSDYGLIVEDAELTSFMQEHQLGGRGGKYFSFGRPVREVFGALHALTKQNLEDDALYSISLSDDPRRQRLQRQLYQRQAKRWQEWWEAHWKEFTQDEAYRRVGLTFNTVELGESPATGDSPMRIGEGGVIGMVLSPFTEKGKYVDHFLDLDTGLQPKWPKEIAQQAEFVDEARLAEWAAENGVDLMCVIHRGDDGTETYALKGFGMRIREISLWDAENIEKRLASGKLPEGQAVGELLFHFDKATRKYVPEENAAFIYVTREGGMGMILVTDRVTRKANLTGMLSVDAPTGVGFQKGVRFNHRTIVRGR